MTNALFASALAVWFVLLSPLVLRRVATAMPAWNEPLLPPFLLVLVFSFLPYVFSVPRQDGTAVLEQGLSASNIASVALTTATGLYLVARMAMDRRLLLLPFAMPYLPFTLMLGCDAASAAWSILPSYTLYRSLEVTVFFCATILAFDRTGVERRIADLLGVVTLVWLAAVAPVVLDSLKHGIVFSAAKNNLMPLVCAALMLQCLFQPATPRRLPLAILGFAGFVIAGSASSTGALLSSVAPALLIASRTSGLRVTGFGLAAITLGIFAVLMLGLSAFPALLDFLSIVLQKPAVELANATGRDTIWPTFLAATRDHMVGSGFSAADRFVQLLLPVGGLPDALGRDTLNILSAHNMFLSAWAGTGVLGLCFAVLVLATTMAWGLKLDRAGRRFVTAFTLMLIYNGLTTPGIFQDWTPNTLVFAAVLAFARVDVLRRRADAHATQGLWAPHAAGAGRAVAA